MRKQIFLIIFLGILTVLLLVGQRFGATWAGGDGYLPSLPLEIADQVGSSNVVDTVRRGQIVSTDSESRLLLSNELIEVALDENTDLEIIRLNKNEVELYVHRGRIGVRSWGVNLPVSIRSDYVRSNFESPGQISFVYYDFLNKVSIIPFDDLEVSYSIADTEDTTVEPIDISELEPYTIEPFEFKIPGSTAEEFYNWIAK